MDYGQLVRFVRQHGKVSFVDTKGKEHLLPSGNVDSQRLAEEADRFLWDGMVRSRAEMESLVAQSERGEHPGCKECDQLHNELIVARDRDRREQNLEMRHEGPALRIFQEHRLKHQ